MQQKLLALFAHPDDESFGMAGVMMQLAKRRIATTLVCATRGEVGEISHPALANRKNLAAVRERELRAAAQTMRLSELIFLGYRDSGMDGSPENTDPRAFVNQPPEEVVRRLVGIVRRQQPTVVVTFDPTGGYGHPDHLAIHRHTVAAFHAAGDPSCYPEEGAAWQSERLFYTVVPRSMFATMREQLAALGEDPTRFAAFEERATPDEAIHVTIDVREQVTAKLAALNAHRTQFAETHLFKRMPPDQLQSVLGRENFVQAWPSPPAQHLTDLFVGLAD